MEVSKGQQEGSKGQLVEFQGQLEGSDGQLEGSEGQLEGPEGQPAVSEVQKKGDGQMDKQTEFFPILQVLVPIWGRCPKTNRKKR